MSASIVVIQFRRNPFYKQHEAECITRAVQEYANVSFIDTLDVMHTWDNPLLLLGTHNGIILGGSGDFDFDGGRVAGDPNRQMSYVLLERLRTLFDHIFTHDIPTFGICYGHQLIGAFAGAEVRYDKAQRKSRSHEVRLLVNAHDHFLFTGLPTHFHAYYGHKDSLDRVPEGATLVLEGGEACQVSALQYKNNIFTTQFHPELTFTDMVERIKNLPGYLPEGAVVEDLFKEGSQATRILENFAQFVAKE